MKTRAASARRQVGPFTINEIGLGCMSLSHAYGTPPAAEDAEALLLRALELGVEFFDTASLYGFGSNETLLGRVLSPHRDQFVLASKCGMTRVDGKRVIDGRPETLKRTCEESLQRLRTEVIDLYYLHRLDRAVPIEDSVGALAELVAAGKIRAIGLSEVSAETLRRAHAVHPIAAVQTEYSLWSRNAEIGVLDACRELGAAFVAFSPLARAFLTGELRDPSSLHDDDLRRRLPRFLGDAWTANLRLLEPYGEIAREVGCTMGQLALAWLLSKSEHIVPIPGTASIGHLEENMGAIGLRLPADVMARLDALINQGTVTGPRYTPTLQQDIDTEQF